MGSTQVGTPVTTTDGDDAQLGDDDSSTDGSGNLLGGLDAETDVTLRVTDNNDGLEAGTLTGTGLLLDGLDLFAGGRDGVRIRTSFPLYIYAVAASQELGLSVPS